MIPLRTLAWLAGTFVLTFLLNYFLWSQKLQTGTTWLFPLSQFIGPDFHMDGVVWAGLFLGVFFLALRMAKPHWLKVWVYGLTLLILGNLIQGSWQAGFHFPFTAFGVQYYQDALLITDVGVWLSGFNEAQPGLTVHAKTHPAMAVLMHWVFLAVHESLNTLAVGFTLLASLAFPMLWCLLRTLGHERKQTAQLVILFAVLPAWNIYGCVSLDGLIAMAAILAYLGLVRFLNGGHYQGMALFAMGAAVMNFLTFAGTFILLVGWLTVIHHDLAKGTRRGSMAMGVITASGLLFVFLLNQVTGYDHIQAFFTASHLENPEGFLAFARPLQYAMTRLAGFWEIALFASPLFLAYVLGALPRWNQAKTNLNDGLIFWGVMSLFLMFLVGAFRVGETGRACLFIYPLLLLAVRHLEEKPLQITAWVAALTTMAMQLTGSFIW